MLTHFSALLVFSACLAVVFGITQRDKPPMMIRFGAFTFLLCVFGTVAVSWLLFLIKR